MAEENTSNSDNLSISERKLRYSEYLEPFDDYSKRNFRELDSPTFRTYCTVSGTDIDLTPQ